MKVTLWGTRGSLPTAGPDTDHYGGNTTCVEVRGADGTLLVLDAGSGIRRLGNAVAGTLRRVDLLLTHLHMDHVQGLGFFAPLYEPGLEVHIWGPASPTLNLHARLTRYLSPPLFPVRLRDLPSHVILHDIGAEAVTIGPFEVRAALICHPGPTLGYRIAADGVVFTFIPDHEPALGIADFPLSPDWTSGYSLAAGADLLIHDAQYTAAEYDAYVGWGHSALPHTLAFARLAAVKRLVLFHHDPGHDDRQVEGLVAEALAGMVLPFTVSIGAEGDTYTVGEVP